MKENYFWQYQINNKKRIRLHKLLQNDEKTNKKNLTPPAFSKLNLFLSEDGEEVSV